LNLVIKYDPNYADYSLLAISTIIEENLAKEILIIEIDKLNP